MISGYSFSQILICSKTFEKEIIEQLIKELKIKRNLIMTLDEMIEVYYRDLVEKQLLLKRKILVVGTTTEWNAREVLFRCLFNICGFVEIQTLEKINNFKFDYIMLTNLMQATTLDRRKGRLELEKMYINNISKLCGIDASKILTFAALQTIAKQDKMESWGKANENKTFYLIKGSSQYTGLGGGILRVANNVAYARERGYIPVIDFTNQKQYLESEENGNINAWEKFFEQPEGYNVSDIQKSKNVICSFGFKEICLKATFDFLKMKPMLKKMVTEKCKIFFEEGQKVLGVLFRGSDYANRRPYDHWIQPDLITMILTVKEKIIEWGEYDRIYLCTEVEETVLLFQSEFGDKVCFYPQKRVHADYNKYLAENAFSNGETTYERGANYWIALNVLAKCDALVAGKCAGTFVALELNNGKYENVFLFELGKYGLDDVDF